MRTKVVRRGISSRVLAPMYLAHRVARMYTYHACIHMRFHGGGRWEGRGDLNSGGRDGVRSAAREVKGCADARKVVVARGGADARVSCG